MIMINVLFIPQLTGTFDLVHYFLSQIDVNGKIRHWWSLVVYRMEFDMTRWSQNSAMVTILSLKTGPCAIVSSQTSSKFTGEVVYYLLCILVFLCQYCQLARILHKSEMSNNRGFWPFDRHVTNTLAALLFNSCKSTCGNTRTWTWNLNMV